MLLKTNGMVTLYRIINQNLGVKQNGETMLKHRAPHEAATKIPHCNWRTSMLLMCSEKQPRTSQERERSLQAQRQKTQGAGASLNSWEMHQDFFFH